jgi:hypothetical protein
MIISRAAGRRLIPVLFALAVLGSVSACVPQDTQATAAVDPAQPRVASYDCGDGARITVENLGPVVRVVDTDGSSLELPAAPASQNSRFGAGADAIVIEGREALLMRGRHTPLTCTR